MKDLQCLITSNYSRHWKGIGIELDISIDRLICIEKSHPTDLPSCCNDMLIHWYQSDEEASWNKIIKAIDIVVASNKNYSCSLCSSPSEVYKTREAVSDLACRLKEMSKNNRYKSDLKDDNWPVATPKHFTSVALIHHKGERTKREVLDIANLQKRGNFDLDKIHTDGEYFKQSKCSKKISDIFAKVKCANGITKSPGIVLIEGVPGIGKTVLSKEIVFQWANGELLSDHIFVFLIPLRDTESQKIDSVKSFINYFGYPQVTEYIVNYIIDSKGKNITIVFDGYDELSEKLRNDSFLYKMMTQNVIEMPFCNVVITSRPNASAHLHDKVDLRVEILGFTNEDRKTYIVDALKHNDNKIEKVMTYLNNNPAINAYCYIPLNMTILLSFFESSDTDITELPNTQTGINEKFICTTISRYIRKLNGLELDFSNFSNIRAPCDDHKIRTPCVGHEKGVPYGRIFKEISKLAFKALEKDKIVFTTVELQETCPCLEAQSENWNGLGLLKPVQLFTVQNISRNVSFNFLHFTIQEILAAYHITLMSKDDQLKCMKQTFWDNRYYNTWIMYVGLTKNQMPITFKHFLSGNRLLLRTRFLNWWKSGTYCRINRPIINDKIKCLHLFQCFSEAENKDLCQYVGQLLQENKIDLSGQTLSAVNILTISLFLTRSTTRHWNIFNLSECYIGDDGIKQLHNSFTSNNRSKVYIDTLNLSHNNLTQSSVESIAGLILEWDVKDIMFNEINQNNLYQEVMHQVMQYVIGINNFTACNFNENEVIFARLSQSDYLILSISSTSGKRVHRIENIFTQAGMQANNIFRLKMIICALNNCTAINYLSLGVDISPLEIVDMAEVIANNNFIEYLYLSKMQHPGKVKLKMIIDALKSNKSLQYVDMSLITIDSDLISDIAVVMNNNSKLKEIKVSKLILTHNDFQHLGNYLVKITGLKSLNITGYIYNRQDADKLVIAIKQNYEIWQLNLSNCKVPIDHLLNILSYKSIMEKLRWLDLSGCHLHSKEMKQILSVLKEMEHLQHVYLSANIMESDAITDVAVMIKNNQDIQVLSLPNFVLNQKDIMIIIQAMQNVSSLEYVDFDNITVDDELASDVALLFTKNSKLKEFRCSKLTLNRIGFQHLNNYLVKIKGLTTINIIGCSLIGQNAVRLVTVIKSNSGIHELNLSNCRMPANQSWSMLSYITKLKYLNLSQCLLQPNETKEIFSNLNRMKCLQHVNLSANIMEIDAITDVAAMIKNNQDIQALSLPNCILDQKDLMIIIQAMQNVSSLEYVDFNNNTIDSELASDVALLFTKNSKIKEFRFAKLILNQVGFQNLNNYLVKIKGLTTINIIGCSLKCLQHVDLSANIMKSDAINDIAAMIKNNQDIQVLSLQKCVLDQKDLMIIIQAMQTVSSLEYVDFNNITVDNDLASDVALLFTKNSKLKEFRCTKLTLNQVGFQNLNNYLVKIKGLTTINIIGCSFIDLKWMKFLQHVDLSANVMESDAINDIAAMIKNNQDIQVLSLQKCVLDQKDLMIIIQAMQTVSSLEYVDFNNITVDSELASDVAHFFTKNSKLKEFRCTKLTLNQIGFQHLNDYLVKIKGLTTINIIGCSLIEQNAVKLVTAIKNNSEIQELNLSNCRMPANQLWSMLSYITKLKYLNLSQCLLQPNETKEIFGILKRMKCLQHVDLSANIMESDAINDVAAMIKNNQDIQVLSLQKCVLDQKDIMIIIQAMQNVSSLEYVDFNNITVDDELASDVALLFTKNSKLKEFRCTKLTLNQIGFQHLNNYLVKIKGLTTINIIGCSLIGQNAVILVTAIKNNAEIQELNLSNCRMPANQSWSMLSHVTKLKYLNLSQCLLKPSETKEIFGILKWMNCLQHVDLNDNNMRSDAINDVAAMIKNNEHIQSLSLPNGIIKRKDYKIIFQAMHTILNSSLEYVRFNNITVDSELASDVALFFTKNSRIKEFRCTKLTLNRIGFQHLNNYLVKIKGLTTINIIGCSLFGENAVKLVTAINNNSEIQKLNLPNCIMSANQLCPMLSCITKLKYLNLSHCLLETKKVFGILKCMNHLQHVNLSANIMESDAINDVAAMIKNNQDIQVLSLPNFILDQKDLMIIIQAMQTSSLEYVDFNNITVDSELASDVALLFTKNSKLKEFRCTKLTLNLIGFQHLNNYLVKIKGLITINIIGCSFIAQDAVKLVTAIKNNSEIQELNLSNCRMPANQSWSMLSHITKLKYLNLSQCLLQPNEIKEIFVILKCMKCLHHVDLSDNIMGNDAISDVAAMIKNNKHIQSLSLPNGIINKKDFKIVIQAMQTVSSLQFVDFSTNKIDNDLANDISSLFASSNKLELNFCGLALKHNGFQHLMRDFAKLKGIQHLSITDCMFTYENVVYLKSMIGNNHKIRELLISNCKMSCYKVLMADNIGRYDQLETLEFNNNSAIAPFSTINPYIQNILVFLSCSSKLRQVTLCNCQLQPDVIKQILMVLKYMRHLETVDLSGNDMTDDSVSDMETMIVNNKQLQRLCLPNFVLNQASLKIICQALQSLSSLQYVDFSTNIIDSELASVLKQMKHLRHVSLSATIMTGNAISEMAAMIKDNREMQALSLPNCVLDQKDFRIIIQAMQTVSSLEYVDFSVNEIDNELASDVAVFIAKNSKLKEFKFSKLTLNQSGFKHLNNFLKPVKIIGLTTFNMTGCSLIGENALILVTVINNNTEIQELNLSNCLMPVDQSWSMLSCITKLKCLNLSNCLLQPNETKEIFSILMCTKCLRHVDLSANNMDSDAINDVAAMIKNNEHIQSLSLPNGIINKEDFKIVIQAMQTVSSLQYVDFSTNVIDNELASDISALFTTNSKLQELRFCGLTLKQSGFQHLVRHFTKLKGIECLCITDCMFTDNDVVYLKKMIGNNQKIRKMLISNCKLMSGYTILMADNIGRYDQLETLDISVIHPFSAIHPYIYNILVFLSCSSKLRQMTLCNCQLRPDVTKQILIVLKYMRHLETVDLSGNDMTDDSVSDMEAMIVKNKQLQRLCLPNCVLNQASLKIICQALQSLSSLQYVDFGTNRIEQDNFLNLKSHHVTIVQESS